MINTFLALFSKEWKQAIRCRRTFLAALYYSLGTPFLVVLGFSFSILQFQSEEKLTIHIENQQLAPDLTAFIQNQGFELANAEQALFSLLVSQDYAQQQAQGEPAQVTLLVDLGDDKQRNSMALLQRALQHYSQTLAAQRLLLRGMDPVVIAPLDVQVQDSATPKDKGAFFFTTLLMLLVYAFFITGMSAAVDTTAGERERSTLVLLLSHPLPPSYIVLSKVAMVSVMSYLGFMLCLITTKFALPLIPWDSLGVTFDLSWSMIGQFLLLAVPVAFLAAAFQLLVAFFGKSYKEAQSYVSLALVIPAAMVIMSIMDLGGPSLHYWPIAGQVSAMTAIVDGEPLSISVLLIQVMSTMALFTLLCVAMRFLLKREKFVFGV